MKHYLREKKKKPVFRARRTVFPRRSDRRASGDRREKRPVLPGSGDRFEQRAVYLDSYRTKRRPAWLIPAVITAAVLLAVFWTGPFLLNILSDLFTSGNGGETDAQLLYDSPDYAVVIRQSADLFLEPDLRSQRVSQILYNDLVKITGRGAAGFYQVVLADGTPGYVMTRDVVSDTKSVEPGLYQHRLTVIAKTKRILSHASKGSLLAEVCMGTVLYSDYRGDGIYRVSLPDGTSGWISSEGVLRTETDRGPDVSSAEKFYETALSFVNTTYVDNGITCYGASASGIAYVCAMVNGLAIPREIAGQAGAGDGIPVRHDTETGLPLTDDFQKGDLIFFGKNPADPGSVTGMGIIVGQGQVLMTPKAGNAVRIASLEDDKDLALSIVAVRRIFIGP